MKIKISLAFVPPDIPGGSSPSFRQKLQHVGVLPQVIDSILAAVSAGSEMKDMSARAYARSMEVSFDDYGLRGLSLQIDYFLLNARTWTGNEAASHKKILKKWARAVY